MKYEEATTFLITDGYVQDMKEAEAYLTKIKENDYAPNMGVSEELFNSLKES